MAQRTQSPSSINTYKQCPRKYYYIYIKKLKTSPSIHLVRGTIAHTVLEDFFDLDVEKLPDHEYVFLLMGLLNDFLKREWKKAEKELNQLNLKESEQLFYYDETQKMLASWLNVFLKKLQKEMKDNNLTFKEAFKKWIPNREEKYQSDKHKVMGYIDAIHHIDDDIIVMDYKTSKRDHISPEYKLQLGIYALMYYEKHGKYPTKAAINFLRHGERYIDVDEDLIKKAILECELIQINTLSEDINDFPQKTSPLCKWHSGQCDFYELCFGKK